MIDKIKISTRLILLALIVGGSQACTTTNSQNNTEELKTDDNTNISKLENREIKSTVVKQNASVWKIKTTQISKNSQIEKVYFYNEKIGFGLTSNKIFKTTDGGESWKEINSIANFELKDIFFINDMEGFAVAYKLWTSNGSYIMKTEDGGQNWKATYSSNSIVLEKLAFSSEGVGVAVGRKDISNPHSDTTNFVLLTNNKGQTWTDISSELNKLAVDSKGLIGDYLTNIKFTKDKSINVLSIEGRIYNTFDQGRSWKLVSKLVDEPDQTAIKHFGRLEDGRFWIAGGTISQEGHWGMIAVMNNDVSWDRFRLTGYYFADVEFLSNNKVIASGSLVAPYNFGGANELNKGVILYSLDSGKNWTVIHESQTTNEFASIAKLSEQKILVGGKNGELVFLERADKN